VAKNGAGKSTLLKLLMKEIDVSDGAIEWRE
jgi:ABC-type cobalamin/Fe3+-siderophores transport system ATPase subunit